MYLFLIIVERIFIKPGTGGGGSYYSFLIQPKFRQYLIIIDAVYKVSQDECARLREGVPYVKVYRYNPKHLYPKLNGYGDNGQRILKL